VEHVELISDEDLPRFASLGAIASMQPAHRPLGSGGSDLWPERVGPHRWRRAFAWRSIRDAGAHLAFGSDWTVASMNPLVGIHAALTAPLWQASDPDQRQTLQEALFGYTRDAAFAEFMEGEKGILKEDYLADIVILSEDIHDLPHEELPRVQVDLTICDGKITYSR
jgi:predicted amidohydrolase YtcJ